MSAHLSRAAIVVACFVAPSLGQAAPRLGEKRPDVVLDDAWGRQLTLARYNGMATLVVYEDKDSSEQNAALKSELSALAAGDKYKGVIALLAIADVTAYDFWPARGFVKDAIRQQSRKFGTPIFCDWTGNVRRAIGATANVSNVVLYGKDDRVVFAHAGPLDEKRRAELVSRLRSFVETAESRR